MTVAIVFASVSSFGLLLAIALGRGAARADRAARRAYIAERAKRQ
jgi:hypothetical protein